MNKATTKTTDPRVIAVRNDPLVGKGTCTSVDEATTDSELVEELDDWGATTPEEAIKAARDFEEMWVENALNCRFGEDTDPELKLWAEWKKNRSAVEANETPNPR